MVLESERFRRQVSEGQCSRYGLQHRGGGDLTFTTLVYYKENEFSGRTISVKLQKTE